MENKLNYNKKEKILIGVTITSLLMIFIGIGYAYFTANNPQGSTAEVISETGKMVITYNDGTDNIAPVTDIQPSNVILVNKTFTLTGTNTAVGINAGDGLAMPYKVGIEYTSGFSDGMLHYYIKSTSKGAGITEVYTGEANQTVPGNDTYTGYYHGTFKNGNKYTEMVTGEFPASLNDQTITFNLLILFPDNNENQDTEKGKTFNGKIVINYEPETIAQTIAKLDYTENGLEVDDTPDHNLRYVGATPRNYLNFNDETWRIIGLFNVYNVDTGQTEKLVKIIRNDSLGYYSWDSSESSINSGYGINEWSQADLMTELNIDYLDTSKTSGTTTWYNGSNNTQTATYDYSKNIKSTSIDKIANVRWNTNRATYGSSALNTYNQERSTTPINTPSDGITRNITWDGKVALMYPSDYGYASIDTTCRDNIGSYDSNFNAYCKNNNWLFNSSNQWTLSPYSDDANGVFYVHSGGFVIYYNAYVNVAVRPALFLKSDVLIAGGTGENIENAYTLE